MALIPLPSFGTYSKLINGGIGSLVGAGIGMLFSYLATQGFGSCVSAPLPDDAMHQVCTVLGLKDTQITEALMLLFGMLFVHQSPPNEPKPVE